MENFNSKKYLGDMLKYWNASNYISLGQLYLLNNPLLKQELVLSDIKKKIVGHWGTVPGQNFIYTHLNRIINKFDQEILYISGPGHGGNFFIANSYLEGVYSEVYPNIQENEDGLKKLFKQFSFPGGVSSHVAPETPGSIHEGGELGYSLSHGFGAVFDNPNLIATVVVGDGEAETGPLATSWHGNKFINPKCDGAVLPILHLNGYKIANPSILARIPKKELKSLFIGYGWKPYFVEYNNNEQINRLMANTLDRVIKDIKFIQKRARENENSISNIKWPMIILKTPKGWSCPKIINGKPVEGTFRAHQVPITMQNEGDFKLLKNWLLSYKPNELFDKNGKLIDELKRLIPQKEKRISANIHANGGKLLKELLLPELVKNSINFDGHGTIKTQDMLELSKYLRDVFILNEKNKNFRIFSPDEAKSNRLNHVFEVTKRDFNAKIYSFDEDLSFDGRVMDSFLSEHMCEGWLEGYILTGRHGIFASYEAFARIVDSMISQIAKWLKTCSEIKWREDISSLNLILTSNVWQQDHNGFTHQDPGLLNHIIDKKSKIVRAYLPFDANSLMSCVDHCLKSKNYINVIVASKHPSFQWLNMTDAIKHCTDGIGIFSWASFGDKENPDIVLSCCGDTPTLEMLACCKILHEELPNLSIRFINVVDLMILEPNTVHPHGLSNINYDKYFTQDKPIIFAFHGYPKLIHELTYKRHNDNLHVCGYKEEGAITTAFDMRVLNKIDRFHLVLMAIHNLPNIDCKRKSEIINKMNELLDKHTKYIREFGEDIKEVTEWKWN